MKKLFSEYPAIENEQIILRKLTSADTAALDRFARSTTVYRYLPTFLYEQKYDDAVTVIDKMHGECFVTKESLILGVYLKSPRVSSEPGSGNRDVFCGLAEFYGYKDSIHKVSMGYRLAEEFWGRGIATQTVGLMVDYLYSQTDIEIITASTMIENKASARVLEKCGFLMTAANVPEDWGFDSPTMADKWFR